MGVSTLFSCYFWSFKHVMCACSGTFEIDKVNIVCLSSSSIVMDGPLQWSKSYLSMWCALQTIKKGQRPMKVFKTLLRLFETYKEQTKRNNTTTNCPLNKPIQFQTHPHISMRIAKVSYICMIV
jgi:hypothetical protein